MKNIIYFTLDIIYRIFASFIMFFVGGIKAVIKEWRY